MRIRLFFSAVFCLFGTFLHELAHFVAALFLGKPEGFSIIPRLEGNAFIFGEVHARVRYRALSIFIAGAPLIWWAILLLIVKKTSVSPGTAEQRLNASMLFEKLRSFSRHDVLYLWLAFQLLWAGRLSVQDIRTCIRGLISPSGLVLILLGVLLFQLFRHIR